MQKPNRRRDFWAVVDIQRGDECWVWMGAKHHSGYGVMSFGCRCCQTHRLAWFFAHGPIPRGLCVCHHCDNPPCCNPAHLFLGTRADNTRDAIKKGRMCSVGSRNPNAKLTPWEVKEIRRSSDTHAALARMFGVTEAAVWRIKNHKTWKLEV
jgi:hypothetical protein